MGIDLHKLLETLADRMCERRAYSCLLRFMPAYFAPDGTENGRSECQRALEETLFECQDELLPLERNDLEEALLIISQLNNEQTPLS